MNYSFGRLEILVFKKIWNKEFCKCIIELFINCMIIYIFLLENLKGFKIVL